MKESSAAEGTKTERKKSKCFSFGGAADPDVAESGFKGAHTENRSTFLSLFQVFESPIFKSVFFLQAAQ